MSNYIEYQVAKLALPKCPEDIMSIQIVSGSTKTNFINISEEELNQIAAILVKRYDEK
jgi:hypothetical protein